MKPAEAGLSDAMQMSFRQIAVELLKHKKGWTHGEISFEFALKQNTLCASVLFESNYNMASIVMSASQRRNLRELL